MPKNSCIMQIWAEPRKSALPICNYSQILYQFLTFTQNLKRSQVIKLEHLQNIRSTTRKSRKNNHSLHTWSFYRLAQFIEYKAKLAGISVEYVDSAYTSQRCPICGSVHHADDRNYTCECGFHIHRDLLGAMNICNSTEFVGNRQTA